MDSLAPGQRVWIDLRALYEPAGLVQGAIVAWGIGTIVESGNGEPGITVELEGEAPLRARAPRGAIVTSPLPFGARRP